MVVTPSSKDASLPSRKDDSAREDDDLKDRSGSGSRWRRRGSKDGGDKNSNRRESKGRGDSPEDRRDERGSKGRKKKDKSRKPIATTTADDETTPEEQPGPSSRSRGTSSSTHTQTSHIATLESINNALNKSRKDRIEFRRSQLDRLSSLKADPPPPSSSSTRGGRGGGKKKDEKGKGRVKGVAAEDLDAERGGGDDSDVDTLVMLCAHARELERQAGELRKGVEKVMERFGVRTRGRGAGVRSKMEEGGDMAVDGGEKKDERVGKDGGVVLEGDGGEEEKVSEGGQGGPMDISTPLVTTPEVVDVPTPPSSLPDEPLPNAAIEHPSYSPAAPAARHRPSIPTFFDLASASTSDPSFPVSNPLGHTRREADADVRVGEFESEPSATFPSIAPSPTTAMFGHPQPPAAPVPTIALPLPHAFPSLNTQPGPDLANTPLMPQCTTPPLSPWSSWTGEDGHMSLAGSQADDEYEGDERDVEEGSDAVDATEGGGGGGRMQEGERNGSGGSGNTYRGDGDGSSGSDGPVLGKDFEFTW